MKLLRPPREPNARASGAMYTRHGFGLFDSPPPSWKSYLPS